MGANQYHDAWNHVLYKIQVSAAQDILKTSRAQAKKCTMSGAIQSGSWRSRLR
jgi:hypothetical protein